MDKPEFGSRQEQDIVLFSKSPVRLWGPPSLLFGGYRGQGVKLTTHLHLVPRLRTSGAIILFSLHVFMVLTGTSLPFYAIVHIYTYVQYIRFVHDEPFVSKPY